MNLKDAAMAYEQPKIKNICDLEKVPIDVPIFSGEGKDSEGAAFKYNFVVVDGQEYRVPGVVLGQIKTILTKYPDTKYVTVDKQGTGLNTRYMVFPFYDQAKWPNHKDK